MAWFKLAGAAALVGLALWFGHWNREQGRTEVLAEWSASQLAAEQAVRQLESTWQDRVATARNESDEKLRVVADTAGRVSADNDRLRDAASKAANRTACPNATAAKGTRSPGDLLADVLSRAGERAAALAAYADRERIAREECQAAWPR